MRLRRRCWSCDKRSQYASTLLFADEVISDQIKDFIPKSKVTCNLHAIVNIKPFPKALQTYLKKPDLDKNLNCVPVQKH